MLDYRQSVQATLSFDGMDELVRLTQDSSLGPDLGDFALYRNGFLIETGFGPTGYGVTYERNSFNQNGYLIQTSSGFANEDLRTDYNLDGSYTFHRAIDTGFTEDLIVRADGSGERTTVQTQLGDEPPIIEKTDYPAGTFDVDPLQPSAAATTRLQYAFDDQDRVSRLKIANDDGGYTVVQFDYSGAKLAERHLTYDKAGRPVEEDRFDAVGNLYYVDRADGDGSHTTTNYAPPDATADPFAGPLKLSETVYYADKSSLTREYDANGKITATVKTAADGVKVKDFAAADGHHTNTYLGGTLALGELLKADGSKEAIVFQKDVALADTAGNDVFTSYGKDTFVFGKGGHDVVRNFHAVGELSDTLKLVGVQPEDYSISMAGKDTVLHFDHDASITLANVKMADVTDNILFA